MKRLMVVLLATFAICGAWADTWTDPDTGYTWTYKNTGVAAVEISDISPLPTGAVTIPSTLGGKSVESIGYGAFAHCDNLTSVTIPGSVTRIEQYAFAYSGLTSVTIPDGVTEIDNRAFNFCYDLTSLTIPDSAVFGMYGGWGSLVSCSALTSVTLGEKCVFGEVNPEENFDYDGTEVFYMDYEIYAEGPFGGSPVTNFVVSENNAYNMSKNGFLLTKDGKTLVRGVGGAIPDGVVRIGNCAFLHGVSISDVTIPDSVTSIGKGAFAETWNLGKIIIPDSVTTIEEFAFFGSSIEFITIGRGVTSIDSSAFYGSHPSRIIFNGNAPQVIIKAGAWVYLPDFAYLDDGFHGPCCVYVRRGSTGWDGDPTSTALPETWYGLPIAFLPDEFTDVSAAGYSGVYDGMGHGIGVSVVDPPDGMVVKYAVGDALVAPTEGWSTVNPLFTNVCDNAVVWYAVECENYVPCTNSATVTITKRNATLASADGDWIYDGQAHSNTAVTATGFVDGEGVATNGFATITDVGTAPNAFIYAFAEETLAGNYDVTCVTGTLTVAAADMGGWTDDAKWAVTLSGDGAKYDGTEKTCAVSAVAYDGFAITTFTVSGNTATDVGSYTLTVTGTGNFTGSHMFPWSIAKREVTLTSGSDSKVYDGTALVKHEVTVGGDGFVAGEGATYDYIGLQTAVGSSANCFAYTLNDGTKAGNYTITAAAGTLTVTKATVGPGGGNEPGDGEVPDGGESKFDASAIYDGKRHTIDTDALDAAFAAAIVGDYSCMYARDLSQAPALPWEAAAPMFTNAGEYVVWYRVTSPNYEDFTHKAKVKIAPRDIANATIAPIADVTYEGVPVEPLPTVADGDPSIISASDYTVSYSGNGAPGEAAVILTGKSNYTGTTNVSFTILAPPASNFAELAAEIKWAYLRATGTYFAQLKIACTSGLSAGIDGLRFMFADRIGTDGKTDVALWNTPGRAANPNTVVYDDVTYRYVALDPAQIADENDPVVYGVSNVSASTIPVAERTIEMFVLRRVVPQVGNEGAAQVGDFVGYVWWMSGGSQHVLPVVAQSSALHAPLLSMNRMSAPLAAASLDASLAVGVQVSGDSSPYCKLTSFSVSDGDICGTVEVGAVSGSSEKKGSLGVNAKVTLLGAESLDEPFAEIATVAVAADGSFSIKKPEGAAFFKLRLDIGEIAK